MSQAHVPERGPEPASDAIQAIGGNMAAAAAATAADDEGWTLRRSGSAVWAPGDASLFALANGSLGVRGGAEEIGGSGCFLAGVYERQPVDFHERLPGFVHTTDTRVPVADGSRIAVVAGDAVSSGDLAHAQTLEGNLQRAVDPHGGGGLASERVLDLRHGRLRRTSELRTAQGARLRIESERLVAHDCDVLSIRFRVTSIDYTGPLELMSVLDSGGQAAAQGHDPRIGSGASHALRTESIDADLEHAILCQRAPRSGIAVACVQMHRVALDTLECVAAERDASRTAHRWRTVLNPGDSVVLEKIVAYAHGTGTSAVVREEALATARAARAAGHDALKEAQVARMSAFWREADLDIEGDAATRFALRFNLFHVLQSASRSAEHGTAAKGLTGEGYEGHCFWDTEVFVLPVMAFTAPRVARAMLMYRYRTLEAARANARMLDHPRGALYPWRTIAGDECSAHYPSGSAAYHINADIAYAIGLYVDATDDIDFLLEAGAEMLFETARIWPQAGHFDPLRDGAFGIHGVTGPDEYTALVDNNFYTNRMAQRHLQRAVAVWERLSASHPQQMSALAERIDLIGAEVALWRRAAQNMRLQPDPQLDIYPQDDTFLHKPRWDFAANRSDRALLLDRHPMTLYRHQVCKQADVVMALALAGDGLDAHTKRRSFDYYEAITTHDSTLSAAVHGIVACEFGLYAKARSYFDEALRVDLDDLHGNTDHGVHMAAMAGSWLGLVWGFAGLRVIEDEDGPTLAFAPSLPEGWGRYRFGLHWRGRRIGIEIDAEGARYRLLEGEPLRVRDRGRWVELRDSEAIRLDHSADADADTRTAAAFAPSHVTPAFPRPCRALIFDLDGVLTDTARTHYAAWKRLADEIGVPFDETINRRLKGVDRETSLKIILERAPCEYGEAQRREFAERKNGYYRDAIGLFGPQHLLPGARELLQQAKHTGLRVALASASRNAPALIERLGIAELFDAVADPARARPKPSPDLFLAAAAALGVAPSLCIGIEDAAAGIAAIRAAGMAAVGVGDRDELTDADAVWPDIAAVRLDVLVRAL
jgi:beta-phosphoglucomutase